MTVYQEGYYWFKRTASPLAIGGRSRWIAYYTGHSWTFNSDLTEYTTDDAMIALSLAIIGRVEESNAVDDEPVAG